MSKANEALDKMAENARELGLDYEPAQQEPVALLRVLEFKFASVSAYPAAKMLPLGTYDLYTSPPAQRTWVGLTDADKQEAFDETQEASGGFWEFADYLEAKLKEKNT